MHPLHAHLGTWTGINGFRMTPDDAFDERDSHATTTDEASGWGSSLRYGWTHPSDSPQTGLLLIGTPQDDCAVAAAWLDSRHQKPGLRLLTGTVTGDAVRVEMEYEGWG